MITTAKAIPSHAGSVNKSRTLRKRSDIPYLPNTLLHHGTRSEAAGASALPEEGRASDASSVTRWVASRGSGIAPLSHSSPTGVMV
jgi:hypothetical protein